MQIPPGQAALPPNPVPPVAAMPQAERAQAIEPARRVTASREGSEMPGKGRSRHGSTEAAPAQRRGQLLDLLV